MNIYYLAGKLHTDQTIKQARSYHTDEPEQRVIINGEPDGAIGVVVAYRGDAGGHLAGRTKQGAQISVTLPPRIYKNETHAWLAVAAVGSFDPSYFKVQYVHAVEVGL